MNKKIAVVTGSRSEYGLLSYLLKKIKHDPVLDLQLIVTGMHLSPEFGHTYKTILEDGFVIDEKIEMLLSSDSAVGISKSIGLGIIGFADAYSRLQPDLVVLLGDRFETLAAAQAALIAKIPIAHLHGGELSLGAFDDSIRHAITKMSHLHFTSSLEYSRRIIQMGESPEQVHCVGALALDAIYHLEPMSRTTLEEEFELKFNSPLVVITFHPETLSEVSSQAQFQALLDALDVIKNATFIFTQANADPDGRIINQMIHKFCEMNSHCAKSFNSLGQHRYLSTLSHADLVIGNSSSGLIEVPYFKIPTVNIGDRQKGRLSPVSVINCIAKSGNIKQAIEKALSIEFKQSLQNIKYPYGDRTTEVASKIVEVIKTVNSYDLIQKTFYDLKDEQL